MSECCVLPCVLSTVSAGIAAKLHVNVDAKCWPVTTD